MTSVLLSDATLCPVCGARNQCAMEVQKTTGVAQPPCWCTQLDFSADLLASVPVQARGIACICVRCAQAAQPQ